MKHTSHISLVHYLMWKRFPASQQQTSHDRFIPLPSISLSHMRHQMCCTFYQIWFWYLSLKSKTVSFTGLLSSQSWQTLAGYLGTKQHFEEIRCLHLHGKTLYDTQLANPSPSIITAWYYKLERFFALNSASKRWVLSIEHLNPIS